MNKMVENAQKNLRDKRAAVVAASLKRSGVGDAADALIQATRQLVQAELGSRLSDRISNMGPYLEGYFNGIEDAARWAEEGIK